ncbi:MAG TPA: hypothetical protein VJU61_16975 [Polyangiaceae bacterium]|nr:hypothetical protein [Polyangiaceae bacterium]
MDLDLDGDGDLNGDDHPLTCSAWRCQPVIVQVQVAVAVKVQDQDQDQDQVDGHSTPTHRPTHYYGTGTSPGYQGQYGP